MKSSKSYKWSFEFATKMTEDWIENHKKWSGPNFTWAGLPYMVARFASVSYPLEYPDDKETLMSVFDIAKETSENLLKDRKLL